MHFLFTGVNDSLPVVTLKEISGLRWALHRGEYLLQSDENATSPTLTGVALWAVTSTLRRDGLFAANQLSQLDRAAKAPVGLVRGVERGADNKLKLEVWFLEACVEAVDTEEEAEGGEAMGEGGQGTVAAAGLEDQESELGSEILPAQTGQGGRGRKRGRRRAGRRRGGSRPRQGRSGRISRPTARAAALWSSDDDAPDLFSETSAAEEQPPEASTQAAVSVALQPAPYPERQSPLHACLLTDLSAQPVAVPNVRMSLQGHAASSAKAALLLVDFGDMVAPLCHPKRIQVAVEGSDGASAGTVDTVAIGVALAMVLAQEQNATWASIGGCKALPTHHHKLQLLFNLREES